MRFSLIFLLQVFLSTSSLSAQIILDDPSLSRNFRAEVKSLEEFGERFNGYESHPEILRDSLSEMKNIISLFDHVKVINSDNKIDLTSNAKAFCDSILNNNILFSTKSRNVYVLIDCIVKFEGQDKKIAMLLQQQETDNGYLRWVISAVTGLRKAGIIKANKLYNISPVEHEIHFMGLDDVLNYNRYKAFGYIDKEREIDQLSVFLTLLQAGVIDFIKVTDMEVICFDVPGFIFIVRETVRDSTNSGWLISDLIPATQQEKTTYLYNLYTE